MSDGDEDCLFCRIVAGEIGSEAGAGPARTYAFRDIEPAAPVHVLVVPRRHIADAGQVGPDDGDLLGEMLATARQVAEREGIADGGYRLVFNVGDDALNVVGPLPPPVLGRRP